MWRFLLLKDSSSPRWKDSSFPAPGWEDSLFPGAGVSLPAPGLPPGAGSPPGAAGWSLPPFPSAGWKLSSLAGRKTSNRGDILTTVAGLHPHPVAAWLLNIPISLSPLVCQIPFLIFVPVNYYHAIPIRSFSYHLPSTGRNHGLFSYDDRW